MTPTELKLFRLALDKAATDDEAATAASKLITLMRRRGADSYDPDEPGSFRIPEATRAVRHDKTVKREEWPGSIVMPFGKYRGIALARIPPDYLRWCIDNFDENERTELVAAMAVLLDDLFTRWEQSRV
jgi:hypothetical protein